MKKGLFLDDERMPSDVGPWMVYPENNVHWVVVRNYQSFVCEAQKQIFDFYSFDHDLQDFSDPLKEKTGMDCIRFLVEHFIEYDIFPNNVQCFFHTQNPIGKKNMKGYWDNFVSYSNGTLYE